MIKFQTERFFVSSFTEDRTTWGGEGGRRNVRFRGDLLPRLLLLVLLWNSFLFLHSLSFLLSFVRPSVHPVHLPIHSIHIIHNIHMKDLEVE